MKERPILFSGEMVRAILGGHKTQTRRVIKLDIASQFDLERDGSLEIMTIENGNGDIVPILDYCPYGKAGDQLWVREAHRFEQTPKAWRTHYLATYDYIDREMAYLRWHEVGESIKNSIDKNRPSIHMPRWASRIQLKITSVKVQELQGISEDDAHKEGIPRRAGPYILDFAKLWDEINAKRGYTWASNPWVWAIEFKVLES